METNYEEIIGAALSPGARASNHLYSSDAFAARAGLLAR